MGILLRWKNSITYLKLTFQEIPHKKLGFQKGGFEGLDVQMTPRRPAGFIQSIS